MLKTAGLGGRWGVCEVVQACVRVCAGASVCEHVRSRARACEDMRGYARIDVNAKMESTGAVPRRQRMHSALHSTP